MRRLVPLGLTLGLALVISACGDAADETGTTGGEDVGTATTEGADNGDGQVVMENISFRPDEITVAVGTTVTWTNQDSITHTTTSEETVWDSGNMGGGDTFSFTFDDPGTYPYFCEIHPDRMRATVTVEG